jgi:hypothetical protein
MNVTQKPKIVLDDVREVDDAAGTHYETVLTGKQIIDLIENDLLKFEGNIRPDWQKNSMGAKTKRKVNNWAAELLEGNGVIGNLSIRLNPDAADTDYEIEDESLALFSGYFDTGIDSQSRITAIQKASDNITTMNPNAVHLYDRRFAVRIWLANDTDAPRIGRSFNNDGDKVNESAAKSAYQEDFTTDDLVNRLVRGSAHLGTNNVELLSNSVSASSAKLVAFNTLSKAFEDHWTDLPFNEQARADQVDFLVKFWDALVQVRPEFGRVTTDVRKKIRGSSVAGSALSVHGVIAIAAAIWASSSKDLSILGHLKDPATTGNGAPVDYFSYNNPDWQKIGVLVSSVTSGGIAKLTLRTSFQTRKAAADSMLAKVGLKP